MSFPVRERGLKHSEKKDRRTEKWVVPRAGTWIETTATLRLQVHTDVVPRAGTWIETLRRFRRR